MASRLRWMLAAMIVVLAVPAVASAATRSVATTGTDSGTCIGSPCATIQYAVGQAADGDDISIGAGTFTGGIAFNVPNLTVTGAGQSDTTISGLGSSGLPGVVNVGGNGDGLRLQQLTVTGGGNGVYTDQIADNVDLYDIDIVDNALDGVFIDSPAVVDNWAIDTANVTGNDHGVRVAGQAESLCICNSHMDNNTIGLASETIAGDPSVLNGLFVSGSTFNDDSNAGMSFDALDNAQFFDTTVDGSGTSGTDPAGVRVDVASGDRQSITFTGGTVSGSTGAGFLLRADGSTSLTDTHVEQMNIVDNAVGADVDGQVDVSFNHDRIAGNGVGIDASGDTSGTVDATNTWWGCNTGPDTAGCDTTSGAVTADPWITLRVAADPTSLPPDGTSTSTITGALDRNSNGEASYAADATPVQFTTTWGTIDPAQADTDPVTSAATTTLTAANTPGRAYVTATVDNQTRAIYVVGGPIASVDPASYDFGSVEVGSSPGSVPFTVTNTGTADLHVSQVTFSPSGSTGYTVSGDTCTGASVAPGETCEVDVTFAPTTVGVANAELRLISDAPLSRTPLTGTGIGIGLISEPSQWDFGNVAVGTATAKTFTIANGGGGSFVISSVQRSGASQFRVTSDDCTGRTLTPSTSCEVEVTFSPTAAAASAGQLRVNNSGPQLRVPLNGTGRTPMATISPTSWDFGTAPVGYPGSGQTFQVTNTGLVGVAISTTQVTPASATQFAIISDTCATRTLAPGEVCEIQVQFTPTAAGTATGQLRVNSNAAQLRATLTGNGATPIATASPTAVDFGPVAVGDTGGPQSITITNASAGMLSINDVSLPSGVTQYHVSGENCSGQTLMPYQACDVEVTFTPSAVGASSTTLRVNSNAPQVRVKLSGTGATPHVSAEPTAWDFGSVRVGEYPTPKTFTLTNDGVTPIRLGAVGLGGANYTEFLLSNDMCEGQTLNPGATCTVDVRFRPTRTGFLRGRLEVPSNGATLIVKLSGTGFSGT